MATSCACRSEPENLLSTESVTLGLDLLERVGRLWEELEAGLAEVKLDSPKSRGLRRALPLSLRSLTRAFGSFCTLFSALLASSAFLTRG